METSITRSENKMVVPPAQIREDESEVIAQLEMPGVTKEGLDIKINGHTLTIELFLDVEEIEHTRTKARHPQTNGICERFHKTILNELYRITFRRKVYVALNPSRRTLTRGSSNTMKSGPHPGRWRFRKTPMEIYCKSLHSAKEKMIGYSDQPSEQVEHVS